MDKIMWKQKNGELISVDDMDITHLRSVLKIMIKNNQKVKNTKPFQLNGDMAQLFNDTMEDDYFFDDDQW